MNKAGIIAIALSSLLIAGCATQKAPVQGKVSETDLKEQKNTGTALKFSDNTEDSVIVAEFDTVKITRQTFESTKSEMQLVVEDLNRITNNRDYKRWLGYLSEEYVQEYSDPDKLDKVSASLPTKGIKLKNLKDYFNYVFVPSRQNMRVDDIKFVSPTRVYVIMELSPNNPAAIYILEKSNGGWKLVLKNQ